MTANPGTDLPGTDLDELLQRGFTYALSLTHDRAQAEDLLQEACLRLSRRDGPWRFGYLATVVRNLTIDQHRRSQKVLFEPLAEDSSGRPAPNVLHDEALERALSRLRPSDRELLYLNAVEGYSTREISNLVGKPLGTVLSCLHRAKQKLREQIANDREQDPEQDPKQDVDAS